MEARITSCQVQSSLNYCTVGGGKVKNNMDLDSAGNERISEMIQHVDEALLWTQTLLLVRNNDFETLFARKFPRMP